MTHETSTTQLSEVEADAEPAPAVPLPIASTVVVSLPKEIGGSKGPEPTRYGDWEHKGRCTDF
jgi:hypothetical protein